MVILLMVASFDGRLPTLADFRRNVPAIFVLLDHLSLTPLLSCRNNYVISSRLTLYFYYYDPSTVSLVIRPSVKIVGRLKPVSLDFWLALMESNENRENTTDEEG